MQWTTPKQIAIYLTLLLCVSVSLILVLFSIVFDYDINWQQVVVVTCALFLPIYFISYFILKKYIHEKVKVIYKIDFLCSPTKVFY